MAEAQIPGPQIPGPQIPLRLARDVRFRKLGTGGEGAPQGILVRQEDGEVLAVNGVAAEVLEMLDPRRHPFDPDSGGRTSAAVVERLAERYDAPDGELARDVGEFLGEMLETGVVERAG